VIGIEDRTEKNCQRIGGGLTELNCQCGVVFALRFREVTSFSLEKEAYLCLSDVLERMWIDADLNDRFESVNSCNRLG